MGVRRERGTAVRRYWTCTRCHTRWERTLQKCRTQGCTGRRPKPRGPKHAATLRDDSYAVYHQVNLELHGSAHDGEWDPDCCGVCGKPPSTTRHMDRDHDHHTGHPRGLACPGNQGCNALMPRQMTLERARLIVAYLERVEARDRSAVRRD
jgi:hypothetical protein